jgi:hypothetical protein
VHLVLDGSGHDTFNDIVMLVVLRYTQVMRYLRMFKPVRCRPFDWRRNAALMMHTVCFGGNAPPQLLSPAHGTQANACFWRGSAVCSGVMHSFMLQHKAIKELHASLALPLVANTSLAFLKRHLSLSASQQTLIDESLQANSARLETLERIQADAEAEVGISLCLLLNRRSDG